MTLHLFFVEMNDCMKEEIQRWIQQINDSTILPSDIVALNFGLFESDGGYCIYLTGSKSYDESDDDWACNIDFEPRNKYLMLKVIDLTWQQLLSETTEIISQYISCSNHSDLFKNKIVTIGFDDGDLTRIQ